MKNLFLIFSLGFIFLLSASQKQNGTLCLTFDDRYLDNWERAIPLFKQYNARVTFFIYKNIDDEAVASLKKLQDAGHSIGLHGVKHAKAVVYQKKHGKNAYIKNEIMPQLEVCRKNGIKIRAFAYPYSQRSTDTDKELFEVFDYLRTNCSAVKKKDMPLAEADGCFVKKVEKKQLFYGFPASGNFDMNEVKAAMKRAAKEDSILVFYAHNITEKIPKSHHIAFSQLISLLEYAQELGLSVKGMNEL